MSRNLELYLEDIIEAIRKICSYTVLLSFEEFCGDERTVDAVIRNLIVIGEAVKNIPEDTRRYSKDGTRDRVAEDSRIKRFCGSCLF